MESTVEDIQRTLGRMEGKVDQLITEQKLVRAELIEHKQSDREDFGIVGSRIGLLEKHLNEADDKRATLSTELNRKLDILNSYVERFRGAWWLLALIVVVIGGAGAALDWTYRLLTQIRHH